MKIGFLIISHGFSGAEKALYNLISNINNNELNLITNEEIITNYSNLQNIKIINLGKYYNGKYRFMNKVINSSKIIKKLDLDILIIFLSHSLPIYYLLSNRQKTILNLRGEEIHRFINKFKPINKFFMRYALQKSDRIISVSKNQIKGLSDKYIKKMFIIPNGVDLNKFSPIAKINQKKNVVLFIGRIIKEKGIKEILSIAKQLPQYEFWFAGKGDLSKEINLPNTKYLGEKNSEELVNLYNKATICILPSYHEGFSNVGLETIACGRAFICTPDFSEYIENGKDGIIIPAKDENALKNAIIDLMTNEKKRKMIEKNARKKALQYSWDNVAKQYMKVFKEVLKEK